MTTRICNKIERVPIHSSVVIGGASVGACENECLPEMVVCEKHATPDAIRMLVTMLVEQRDEAVVRAESAELGCDIAYRREPTQSEGDAHEYEQHQSMGPVLKTGECFVSMGGWTGRRCRICQKWVWGGPTACEACVAREERDEARALRVVEAEKAKRDVLLLQRRVSDLKFALGTDAAGWFDRFKNVERERDEALSALREAREIAERNARDCAHLRLTAMTLENALNHPANCGIYDNGRCTCGKKV